MATSLIKLLFCSLRYILLMYCLFNIYCLYSIGIPVFTGISNIYPNSMRQRISSSSATHPDRCISHQHSPTNGPSWLVKILGTCGRPDRARRPARRAAASTPLRPAHTVRSAPTSRTPPLYLLKTSLTSLTVEQNTRVMQCEAAVVAKLELEVAGLPSHGKLERHRRPERTLGSSQVVALLSLARRQQLSSPP
jgi:hypothetical protein